MQSVEFANAALLSTWTGETIPLPLDAAVYEKALQQRVAESRFQKKPIVRATDDFTSSFTR